MCDKTTTTTTKYICNNEISNIEDIITSCSIRSSSVRAPFRFVGHCDSRKRNLATGHHQVPSRRSDANSIVVIITLVFAIRVASTSLVIIKFSIDY